LTLNKKLSHTSPIGQALTGKKVGDWVEVEVPYENIYCNFETFKLKFDMEVN
jgi:transcription elongation factor GreA